MRLKISFLMMAILALVATGCRDWFPPIDPNDPDPKPDTPAVDRDLQNKKWCLMWFSEDPHIMIGPADRINLTFKEDGSVQGFGGCNSFWATYKTGPNNGLSIYDMAATKIWCNDNGAYEQRFFEALREATGYEVAADGSSLRIYYGYGNSDKHLYFQLCDSIGTPGDSTGGDSLGGNYELGDTMTVWIRKEVTISSENMLIGFPKLIEESRCPTGATCLWEGNAKVGINLAIGYGAVVELELNTGLEPRSAEVMGYNVELIDVLPHPHILADPNPDGYSVLLRVTKI